MFAILSLLLVVAMPVQAAPGVEISLTADRQELTVGDPALLTLEVRHPAGYQVIIPKLEQVWGDIEVRNQSPATTTANDDGSETTRQTIEVTLFNLGNFETPPLSLTIGDGAGQVFEETAPSLSLSVVPTLAEEDNTLRDIKPQAALSVPAAWPWIAGGLALAAAAVIAGWWAYRRWQGKPFGPARAVDNRPPWQVAYDELARIDGLGLVEAGQFKEHYSLVTDCLRNYLEDQFGLHALDRTTSELRLVMQGSAIATEQVHRFLDLFAVSDLVKFAKLRPDSEMAHQVTGEARALVDATRPRPELETLLAADGRPGREQDGPTHPHLGGMGTASVEA
jgi:hypothetical protein